MTKIAIFGAAGNMGTRAWKRLSLCDDYQLLYVEGTQRGQDLLEERGLAPTDTAVATPDADVVLLAVPDALIGQIAQGVVPQMRSGAMLICLDPAAPHAGVLPDRDDVACFVTHPAHPPIFNDETEMDARRDFFGSGLAKQAIVSALAQGSEADYEMGEAISRQMFGPILRSHRVTVEQMALLEPALSETLAATCLTVIREGMDEAIRRGVPEQAARDFLLGHINIELAILFREIDWEFSAGCKKAIEQAKTRIFRDDWKEVFSPESVAESVAEITQAQPSAIRSS